MVKVLELRGPKALRPLNMFSALMLGLKMLPAYAGESYEEFLARVHLMPEEDQEKMIREAVVFVELDKGEVEASLGFTADANGIPVGAENIKNIGLLELVERIVAVAKCVARFKIDLVSEAEKKKSQDSQLT